MKKVIISIFILANFSAYSQKDVTQRVNELRALGREFLEKRDIIRSELENVQESLRAVKLPDNYDTIQKNLEAFNKKVDCREHESELKKERDYMYRNYEEKKKELMKKLAKCLTIPAHTSQSIGEEAPLYF